MDQGAENYEKYQNGDMTGLEALVRDYRHGLILYIYGITSDMFLSEDLCEDAFFHIMVKKPRYDGKSSFKTWLYRIGRNLAYDALRRQKIIQFTELSDAEADRASLEDGYIKTERQKVLHEQLKKLPQSEQELIWLSYFEDMSAAEIGRLTGKSVGAAQKALSRARQRLRELMEKEGYGNENE